jgi:two-component system, NarL family, sensor kinase
MMSATMAARPPLPGANRPSPEDPMPEPVPQIDSRDHLADAERRLAWTRRAALVGWGLILYWREGEVRPNAVWLIYVLGLVYMVALHWYVRHRAVTRTTSWIATVCDSCLTYLVCEVTGGADSPILPFFYFTTLAGAFRFGVEEIFRVLLLNGGLVVALEVLSKQTSLSQLMLSLYYLGFAAALGAMLAGWARANLDIALARSAALEVERDRSNLLLRRLIRAEEDERKRLAEDLHDRMGPSLFYLQHTLEQCVHRAGGDPETAREFRAMQKQLADCSSHVRSLMNELRPAVLDHFGLYEALSEYLTSLVGSVPFVIQTHFDPDLQAWSSRQDAMLFRLVQEALLNVRKHAGASRVEVSLTSGEAGVVLSQKDDGCGFDPAHIPSGHLGLMMMRERAEAAGGTLHIESAPGQGTTIRVRFAASTATP